MKKLLFIALLCLINVRTYGMIGDLFSAIKNNNVKEVEEIEKKFNLGAVNTYGDTPLMVAVSQNSNEQNKQIIEFLLSKMSLEEINQKNKEKNGITALMVAIDAGNAESALLIINHLDKIKELSSLNERDNDGNNALMHTVMIPYRHRSTIIPVIEKLIKEKVDLNATNNKQNSALILSIKNRFDQATTLLIDNDTIQLEQPGENGENALMVTINQRNTKIADLLIKKMSEKDIEAQDDDGNTALMHAAQNFWPDTAETGENIIKTLLEKNSDTIRQKNKKGDTALFLAIKKQNNAIAKLLIEKSTIQELNTIKNNNGDSALFVAIYNGAKEIVQLLIEKGIALNIKNEAGLTPLICAINFIPDNEEGIEIVKLILDQKVNQINTAMAGGLTALMMATIAATQDNAMKEVLSLLIAKGADLNKKTTEGNEKIPKGSTALDIAKIFDNQEVIKILENAQKGTGSGSTKPSEDGALLKSISHLNHALNSLCTRLKK